MGIFTLGVPIILACVIGITLYVLYWDNKNIHNYIESEGGRLLEKKWYPQVSSWILPIIAFIFGGLFGEIIVTNSRRLYPLTYVDRQGRTHMATCAASLSDGESWTENKII